MLTLITGCDAALGRWVGEHLAIDLGPGAAIGVADGDRLLAAVYYNGFRWPSIEMSVYANSPRWLNRRVAHWCFAYPFRQLRCRRAGASCAAGNRRTRKLLEGLGFKLEGVARQAWPEGDACTWGQARLCGSMRSKWPAPGISMRRPTLNAWLMASGTRSSSVPWTRVTGTGGGGSAAGSATA